MSRDCPEPRRGGGGRTCYSTYLLVPLKWFLLQVAATEEEEIDLATTAASLDTCRATAPSLARAEGEEDAEEVRHHIPLIPF